MIRKFAGGGSLALEGRLVLSFSSTTSQANFSSSIKMGLTLCGLIVFMPHHGYSPPPRDDRGEIVARLVLTKILSPGVD
jgi:hypothetical protein